jgi:hypothetical protein
LWELGGGAEGAAAQPGGVESAAEEVEGNVTELRVLVSEETETPPLEPKQGVTVLGVQVDVDTSAAGFNNTPCYLAWLEGDVWQPDLVDRLVKDSDSFATKGQRSLLKLADGLLLLELLGMRFGHVHQATAAGFTYRLWFPQIAKWLHTRSLLEYLLLLAQEGDLIVAWIGVQDAYQPAHPKAP